MNNSKQWLNRTLHDACLMLVYRVAFSFSLKMEAICSFETQIDFHRAARCHVM
jgi:hypothetical protein